MPDSLHWVPHLGFPSCDSQLGFPTAPIGSSARAQARLAGQRQRGIVMSAGGVVPMTNAFVTLHVLRHHLNCT